MKNGFNTRILPGQNPTDMTHYFGKAPDCLKYRLEVAHSDPTCVTQV